MGLFYQFPTRLDPSDDRIVEEENALIIKTYGPPGIFWGYLAAIFSVMFFLYLASRNSLIAMMEGSDPINRMLALSVGLLMGGLIPVLLGIFFYEKIIRKSQQNLKIIHRLFGVPFRRYHYTLRSIDAFEIEHCLNSPNVARREGEEGSRGFQNNGFYQLKAWVGEKSSLVLDRHSQSRELGKLKELLSRY